MIRWTILAMVLILASCEKGKELSAGPPEAPKKPVLTLEAPQTVAVAKGRSAQARISATVAKGFHVQANPPSQDYLVPVELTVDGTSTLHVGNPIYPLGKPHLIEGEKEPLSTYEGTFEILLPVDADLMAPKGDQVLRGELSYQACDNRRCLFPTTVPIEIPLRITPRT